MRRRDFITLLGGVVTLPLAANAQAPGQPVVGILTSRTEADAARDFAAFRRGLEESGFAEGENVEFLYRFANGRYDLLPDLAADLVRAGVSLLFASGGSTSVAAAKNATAEIPIVFTSGQDPVTFELVRSLNQPGGNLTGVYLQTTTLDGKRLELLSEAIPDADVIAALLNPNNPTFAVQMQNLQDSARSLNKTLVLLPASSAAEIDAAFAEIDKQGIRAVLVGSDPFLSSVSIEQIVALAARYGVATSHLWRDATEAGALISYGTSLDDAYRLAGIYAGQILKGAKTFEIPVQQAARVELIINLKTADALGLTVSPQLLARADEVIE
ncbi:MAG TPA: ABC transporter substrate-binding protein [Propylenella sp.]|nr:ABC transporter substrate-binding protein [Propylenella sp.]